MLVFAYDGSLNGDWVAHYAARFAANTRARALRLVHVQETSPAPALQERVARIADECKRLDVALEVEVHQPGRASIAERLIELVPAGAMVIAGARARPRGRAYLDRTVPARLIAAGHFSVVAIRVVQPGVLGQPGRVLLPLLDHALDARTALPLLRLVGADLRRLNLLLIREVSVLRLRLSAHEALERLVERGYALVGRVESDLRAGLAPHPFELDSGVVVSDDAAWEITVHAAKLHSRLICLDAAARARPGRVSLGIVERVLRTAPADVAVYRSVD